MVYLGVGQTRGARRSSDGSEGPCWCGDAEAQPSNADAASSAAGRMGAQRMMGGTILGYRPRAKVIPRMGRVNCATAVGLLLLAATGGCEDKPDPFALPSSQPPKKGLVIADEEVATSAALAIGTEGETAWRVVVSTTPLSCQALRAAYPERPKAKGGKVLDFWLMQPLEADGKRGPWGFRSAFMTDTEGERGLTTRGAMLSDLSENGEHITIKGIDLACQDKQDMIMLSGDLAVESCGRVPRKEDAKEQPELKLEVAGQPLTIRGATVRPQGKDHILRLTRAPHRCSSVFTEGYDFYIDITFEGGTDDTPTRLKFVSLLGDVFPGDPAGSKGKESFVLKPEQSVVGTVGDVPIVLEGKLEVGDYPVTFAGKVKAGRCTPVATP